MRLRVALFSGDARRRNATPTAPRECLTVVFEACVCLLVYESQENCVKPHDAANLMTRPEHLHLYAMVLRVDSAEERIFVREMLDIHCPKPFCDTLGGTAHLDLRSSLTALYLHTLLRVLVKLPHAGRPNLFSERVACIRASPGHLPDCWDLIASVQNPLNNCLSWRVHIRLLVFGCVVFVL